MTVMDIQQAGAVLEQKHYLHPCQIALGPHITVGSGYNISNLVIYTYYLDQGHDLSILCFAGIGTSCEGVCSIRLAITPFHFIPNFMCTFHCEQGYIS